MRSAASLSSASTSRWRPISGSTWGITAGGCGRGAQPQEREAAAQQAGAVRRGQHLRHRRRAGRQARADPRGHPGGQAAGQAAGEDMRSPLALSTCASRYGRATECSCYWLLNFPYVGVYCLPRWSSSAAAWRRPRTSRRSARRRCITRT